MRVFYIFKIKEEFKNIYYDTQSSLYNMFKQIYYLDMDDLSYARTILKQLTEEIDKEEIDKHLFIKLHKTLSYSKKGEIHILNNLYKDEISKLIIKKSYIKLISDVNIPSFFKELEKLDDNLFICDFTYSDFFFIDSLKTLVN